MPSCLDCCENGFIWLRIVIAFRQLVLDILSVFLLTCDRMSLVIVVSTAFSCVILTEGRFTFVDVF